MIIPADFSCFLFSSEGKSSKEYRLERSRDGLALKKNFKILKILQMKKILPQLGKAKIFYFTLIN